MRLLLGLQESRWSIEAGSGHLTHFSGIDGGMKAEALLIAGNAYWADYVRQGHKASAP